VFESGFGATFELEFGRNEKVGSSSAFKLHSAASNLLLHGLGGLWPTIAAYLAIRQIAALGHKGRQLSLCDTMAGVSLSLLSVIR
jgi:hypothetical protein